MSGLIIKIIGTTIGKIFFSFSCAKTKEKSPAKKSAPFTFEIQTKKPSFINFQKLPVEI